MSSDGFAAATRGLTRLRMAELTSAEMRQALAFDPVLLLPLGSFEDQGPHAPMGDFLSAAAMADRIAGRAVQDGTPCLVVPTLPFGAADFFAPMPGAIALSPATFRAVLDDMLRALLRHGLKRIVLLNGHGGNAPAIHEITLRIRHESGLVIPCFYLWKIANRLLPGIVGAEMAARSGGHGAEPLASITWHVLPELMRPDLIPPPREAGTVLGLPVSGFGTAAFEGIEVDVPVEIDAIAPGGVAMADARLCAPETGAALVERLTEIGARFAAHVARLDR